MIKPERPGGDGRQGGGDPRPLGYLLRRAAGAHRLRLDRALADIEVTPPQFLVMTLLSIGAEQSSADIARRAALTPPTVSLIVSNLERRGALARRSHPVHGRVQYLELTEDGRALLEACRDRAEDVERELAADLPAADALVIRQWLARVGS